MFRCVRIVVCAISVLSASACTRLAPDRADKMANIESMKGQANAGAVQSMEGRMDMGPHMRMTALRQPAPGDAERANRVVEDARRVAAKYTDYRSAQADGYQIFFPDVPQEMYHFINYRNAFEATITFNPDRPTALLYERTGPGYKLVGVMYSAFRSLTEDQLNQRIPLSVARWHEHVNFCAPPPDRRREMLEPHPRFGLKGSIVTEPSCQAAGGTFYPVIFNWMVHVYPFEKDPARVWSVDRQLGTSE
jgi:hypothetical protein